MAENTEDFGNNKLSNLSQVIGVSLSLLSVVFLVSGYLYNFLLLREFGIDVSNFFSLSDYIAASLSRLTSIAVSGFYVLLGVFLGSIGPPIIPSNMRQLKEENDRWYGFYKWRSWVFTGGYVLIVIPIAYSGLINKSYNEAALFLIILAILIVAILYKKDFRRPFSFIYILLFAICFSINLWSSVGKRIDEFQYGDFSQMRKYDLKLQNSLAMEESEFVLITANSSYYFLLDKNRKAIILNKDQLESLIQLRKEPKPDTFFWFYFFNRGN